ncbi:MAG TPA: hypothetical protein VGX75_12435 [bacterium]|nr:hypothetical protein [bacterium]
MLRRVEAATGLATAAAGIVGCLYAAFGPTYRYVGATTTSAGSTYTTSGSASLVQRGLGAPATVYLLTMLLTAVGAAACAYVHSRWGTRAALRGLWLFTAVLWAGVVLGAASLGILLLPAALLAAAASAIGSLAAADRIP